MQKILSTVLCFLLLATAANAAKTTDNSAAKTPVPSKEIPFSIDKMAYVEGNVLATFYHELGHALIDQMDLPVYGREEDAADSFALVLTEILNGPKRSEQITWASADQYVQIARTLKGQEPDYSDDHSPDMVRYYTLICLFYGGDVTKRKSFAKDNGLPQERADYCEAERAQIQRAWTGTLDRIRRAGDAPDWLTVGNVDRSHDEYITAAQQVIRESVAALNILYAPKFRISVDMTDCGEDNAFYDPENRTILMCNEYIPPLTRVDPKM